MLQPTSRSARVFRLVWEVLRDLHDAAYQPSYIIAGSYKALIESERLASVPSLKKEIRILESRGIIRRSGKQIAVTRDGINFGIIRCMVQRSRPLPRGVQCYVTFDIPTSQKSTRDRFRSLLKQLGFIRLHQSVWVSDKDIADHLMYFVVANRLEKRVAIIVGERVGFSTGVQKVNG